MHVIKRGSMYVGVHEGKVFLGPPTTALTFTTQPEAELFMHNNGMALSGGYTVARGYYVVRHPSYSSEFLHGTTTAHGAPVWAASEVQAMQFPDESSAQLFLSHLTYANDEERDIIAQAAFVRILT